MEVMTLPRTLLLLHQACCFKPVASNQLLQALDTLSIVSAAEKPTPAIYREDDHDETCWRPACWCPACRCNRRQRCICSNASSRPFLDVFTAAFRRQGSREIAHPATRAQQKVGGMKEAGAGSKSENGQIAEDHK